MTDSWMTAEERAGILRDEGWVPPATRYVCGGCDYDRVGTYPQHLAHWAAHLADDDWEEQMS